jgi:hypothetical protein
MVEGVVTTWAEDLPQVCPNDGGHAIASVSATKALFNDGQPTAHDSLYMSDGAGRVYQMTIDINGAWQSVQVFGPAP